MFWLSLVGNPIHELALIKRGVVTNGVITDAWEDTGKADDGRLRRFVQSMKAVKANLQIEGRQLSW